MTEFKAHLRAEVVPGEGTYIFSERGVRMIDCPQLELVAPLMDGLRGLNEIVRDASRELAPEEVGYVLAQLADAALVDFRRTARTLRNSARTGLAFWELAGLDGERTAARLADGSVRVLTVGAVDGSAVRAALQATDLTVDTISAVTGSSCEIPRTDLSVVVCDDYLASELAAVDTAHRAAGRPWLLAKPHGADIWLGPVFQPGEGPCWNCLAHRLRGHREVENHVQRTLGRTGPLLIPQASIPPSQGMGLHMVALEAAKWMAGHRYHGQQSVLTLDNFTMTARHHTVQRRPQCTHCGDPARGTELAGRPLPLRSRTKAYANGSGDRSASPENVLARYRSQVSPVTGVVSQLGPDPAAPPGLQVYRAGHNMALGTSGLRSLRQGFRGMSAGKGVTAVEAEVGALCEALERFSGVFTGEELRIRDSLRNLGDRAIHPNRCQLFDERQYADRERWNATHGDFHRVNRVFDVDAEVDWTPVWSLTGGGQRLLPTSLLYYNTPEASGRGFCAADSNGCAAGSSLEDAIVQGFLELIERDSTALWWYNRTRHPGVSLSAFEEPWIAERRALYADRNREVWALDLTADFGIPAVAALSRRTDKEDEDIVIGLGAHFDMRIALRRALTELDQMLPFVMNARPDGTGYDCGGDDILEWCRTATVANQPYLLPDPGVVPRTPEDHPYRPRPDLLDDVRAIERMVAEKGMELLVLEQTRPDIGLPVVKVIVPGLRHFWARFAPGRLYDVPVLLGRRTTPLGYEKLNPVPLFL
ncbi:TOMM precursor leader peptide-binding protein [Streptomyces sp. NPDC006733]|uniref:TOMM precursor leader peptide-binding protein n=1 Tax=Streptomyces sp. NPDC006733 TaxID=3155460 RepID=UPI0033DE381C